MCIKRMVETNSDILPSWSNACKGVLLIQPSLSAAAERLSILSNSFTNRQEHSLKDYIETSVMLQYNSRDYTVTCTGVF